MTNPISQSAKPQFREATNLLRGICALAVLIWHYQHFFPQETNADPFSKTDQPFYYLFSIAYNSGYLAVQIFWSISGLIMTHTYMQKGNTSARDYAVSRFSRLYPLHFVTLIVVAVLQFVSFQKLDTFQIYKINDFFHFLLNLLFIQSWGFERGYSFNAPTWSVSLEIGIYILFFFVVSALNKFKIWVPITILALYKLGVNIELTTPFGECLAYFFSGVLIYFCSTFVTKNLSSVLALSLEVLCFLIIRNSDFILKKLGNEEIFYTAFLVFFIAQIDGSRVATLLGKLRIIGDLSYSVFLWHVPIQIVIRLVKEQFLIDQSTAYNELFFVFFIVTTYLVGYLSHKYIEQPTQRFIRKRFTKVIIL